MFAGSDRSQPSTSYRSSVHSTSSSEATTSGNEDALQQVPYYIFPRRGKLVVLDRLIMIPLKIRLVNQMTMKLAMIWRLFNQ